MTKSDAAIELALSDTGTLSISSVLIGPVGRKARNIAAARRPWKRPRSRLKKAAPAATTVSAGGSGEHDA